MGPTTIEKIDPKQAKGLKEHLRIIIKMIIKEQNQKSWDISEESLSL